MRVLCALFLAFGLVCAVNVPLEWQKTGEVPAPSTEIRLIISLFQENLHELEVREILLSSVSKKIIANHFPKEFILGPI